MASDRGSNPYRPETRQRKHYIHSETGERITQREYRKRMHGGLSNEEYATRRRLHYDELRDRWARNSGVSDDEAEGLSEWQRSWKILKGHYRRGQVGSDHNMLWEQKMEQLHFLYDEDELTEDVVKPIVSPKQDGE